MRDLGIENETIQNATPGFTTSQMRLSHLTWWSRWGRETTPSVLVLWCGVAESRGLECVVVRPLRLCAEVQRQL
jgi:hypothetical protein